MIFKSTANNRIDELDKHISNGGTISFSLFFPLLGQLNELSETSKEKLRDFFNNEEIADYIDFDTFFLFSSIKEFYTFAFNNRKDKKTSKLLELTIEFFPEDFMSDCSINKNLRYVPKKIEFSSGTHIGYWELDLADRIVALSNKNLLI